MSPTDPQTAALLAHVIAQTKSNIEFLVSQDYLAAADVHAVTTKLNALSNAESYSALGLSHHVQNLSITGPNSRSSSPPKYVAPLRRHDPPPTRPVRARALWDYNADGQQADDLSFRTGDVIEIVTETNSDWWTGKINDRQGLFPSNYVEKIPADVRNADLPSASPSPHSTPVPVPPPHFPSGPAFPSPYASPYNKPFTASPYSMTSSPFNGSPAPSPSQHQWQLPGPYGSEKPGMYTPPHGPPPGQIYGQEKQSYAPPQGPPPGSPAPPVEQAQPEKKKSKFGKLGSTMASSAAGGVGFGAGAAVGSSIINAIF